MREQGRVKKRITKLMDFCVAFPLIPLPSFNYPHKEAKPGRFSGIVGVTSKLSVLVPLPSQILALHITHYNLAIYHILAVRFGRTRCMRPGM